MNLLSPHFSTRNYRDGSVVALEITFPNDEKHRTDAEIKTSRTAEGRSSRVVAFSIWNVITFPIIILWNGYWWHVWPVDSRPRWMLHPYPISISKTHQINGGSQFTFSAWHYSVSSGFLIIIIISLFTGHDDFIRVLVTWYVVCLCLCQCSMFHAHGVKSTIFHRRCSAEGLIAKCEFVILNEVSGLATGVRCSAHMHATVSSNRQTTTIREMMMNLETKRNSYMKSPR